MSDTDADLDVRVGVINWLLADAAITAIVGTRVLEVAPPETAFPFLLVNVSSINDDTHSERGAEHEVAIFVEGAKEGTKQGNQLFRLTKLRLRAWPCPVALSGNALANLVFTDQAVVMAEDGKRYAGRQNWRAVTEETT